MKNLLISIIALLALISSTAYADQIQKILADDAAADDNFGYSVSISGDYAIVGAWGEDDGGSYAGAAYIYYRNQGGPGNWGQIKKLTASDAAVNDYFGWSVSISGDYAIVGAYGKNTSTGAAYVYYRNQDSTDNWGQVKELTASDAAVNDNFGGSVSICGDYAIVGARYEDEGGANAGAAYIYYRNQDSTDNWGEVKKLTASDAAVNDYFGFSVSISGDYAIVGAYGENTSTGAAYVFNKDQDSTNNWGEVKKLMASDAAEWDGFGSSVSISGDYAIVGANGESTGGSNAGAAYVFNKNNGGSDNWGEVKKLMASDKQDYDWFGSSVSISGDYAIVGALGEDTGGTDAGAAYVFNKNNGTADNWGEVTKLTASDAAADDYFGWSVSISGGLVNSIVGAYGEDAGGSSAGAAYMFQLLPFIPTLPEWGMIAMGLLFAGIGGWFVFRRV